MLRGPRLKDRAATKELHRHDEEERISSESFKFYEDGQQVYGSLCLLDGASVPSHLTHSQHQRLGTEWTLPLDLKGGRRLDRRENYLRRFALETMVYVLIDHLSPFAMHPYDWKLSSFPKTFHQKVRLFSEPVSVPVLRDYRCLLSLWIVDFVAMFSRGFHERRLAARQILSGKVPTYDEVTMGGAVTEGAFETILWSKVEMITDEDLWKPDGVEICTSFAAQDVGMDHAIRWDDGFDTECCLHNI